MFQLARCSREHGVPGSTALQGMLGGGHGYSYYCPSSYYYPSSSYFSSCPSSPSSSSSSSSYRRSYPSS